MEKSTKLSIFIVILLSVFAISMLFNTNPIDVKHKLLNSTNTMSSYTLDMNSVHDIIVFSDNSTTSFTNTIISKVNADLRKKKMHIDSLAISQTDNGQRSVKTDSYLHDDLIYSLIDGEWKTFPIDQNLWDSQDEIFELINDLQSGKLTRIADIKKDEELYYAFELLPNMIDVKNRQIRNMGGTQNDVDANIKSYSNILLVDKKTFDVISVDENVEIEFFPIDRREKNKITKVVMKSNNKLDFSNINQHIDIKLPKQNYTITNQTPIYTGKVVATIS